MTKTYEYPEDFCADALPFWLALYADGSVSRFQSASPRDLAVDRARAIAGSRVLVSVAKEVYRKEP